MPSIKLPTLYTKEERTESVCVCTEIPEYENSKNSKYDRSSFIQYVDHFDNLSGKQTEHDNHDFHSYNDDGNNNHDYEHSVLSRDTQSTTEKCFIFNFFQKFTPPAHK